MSLSLLSNNVNGVTRPLRQRRVHLLADELIGINVKKTDHFFYIRAENDL